MYEEERGKVIKWVIPKIRADVAVMVILDMVRRGWTWCWQSII